MNKNDRPIKTIRWHKDDPDESALSVQRHWERLGHRVDFKPLSEWSSLGKSHDGF